MKIGFKNLRSLVNTGDLSIKPLTLLLGQNSSGKSTFIRSFPLLKQSLETRTTGPILWYGRFVDFGDFSNALSDSANEDFIEFSYDLNLPDDLRTRYLYSRRNPLTSQIDKITNCNVSIQLKGGKEIKTYTSQMQIGFSDFKIKIIVSKNDSLVNIQIDDESVPLENVSLVNIGNVFLPQVIYKQEDGHYTLSPDRFLIKKIFQEIRRISKQNYTESTIIKIFSRLNFSSNKKLLNSIVNQNVVKGFAKKVANWNLKTSEYKEFRALLLAATVPSLIEKCDQYISLMARNTSYIAPLRATAERYYRPQDLNVDEVDFQGKNLALVLRNLSSVERQEFEKWCEKTFNFYPRAKIFGGNMTINVLFNKDKSEHNIADLGFGFSQILPIITQIWTGIIRRSNVSRHRRRSKIKIYAIEQPELHLHPKVQAMFVDAIIDVIKFCIKNEIDIKFILETHSETIVNTVGTRIYREKLDSNCVNIIMFEKKSNQSVSVVKEVKYAEDGTLKNWPYGFFEEDWKTSN